MVSFLKVGSGDAQGGLVGKRIKTGYMGGFKVADDLQTLAGGHEYNIVWRDKPALELRHIMEGETGENLMSRISRQGQMDEVLDEIANKAESFTQKYGMDTRRVRKLLKDIMDKMVIFDKGGNMQTLLLKQEVSVPRESAHDIARWSKKITQKGAPAIVKDGIKWGHNEFMILNQLGLSQTATAEATLQAMGKDYVGSYMGALLEMSGYSQEEIEGLVPARYKEYSKVKPKTITVEDLKNMKSALKKGTEESRKFSFLKPAFDKIDAEDLVTNIQEDMRKSNPEFWDDFISMVNKDMEGNIGGEVLSDIVQASNEGLKNKAISSTLLTKEQYEAYRLFVREHRKIRLSGELANMYVPGRDDVVDALSLPHKVDPTNDFMPLKVKVDGRFQTVYAPNRVAFQAVKMMRGLAAGQYNWDTLQSDFTDYYNRLFNVGFKYMGKPVQMPGFQQIGISHLTDETNAIQTVMNLTADQNKSKFGYRASTTSTATKSAVSQYSPGFGEVLISKKRFLDIMDSSGMAPGKANELAESIVEGNRNFMMNIWRAPSKDQHSIIPAYVKLIDSDIVQKRLNVDLSNAFVVNSIDAATLSGDFDRDIYSVVNAVVADKDKEQFLQGLFLYC
jgi:hypothetical protein